MERKCIPLRKWISIVLIISFIVGAGVHWQWWLPDATAFALRPYQPLSMKNIGIFLLKHTDPMMKNVARYLALPPDEAQDELFLYFAEQETVPEGASMQAANLSATSGIYREYSGTAVVNGTDYAIEEYLNDSVKPPSFTAEKPAILIYHTHTTECYRNNEGITNTEDLSKSVVAVGKAMKKVFEEAGYQTIHLQTVLNEDFSNAYPTARKEVEKVLEQNPTIQVVLDIHRDSISSNGVDYYPVTKVEGKEAAQIMFVCGTDAKGMSHPEWHKNFAFALQLSRKMGELYGQLSRPVNLRSDRFNTHFTPHTLLVEVGSSANTLSQAIYGGELTAKAMLSLWKNP